MISGSILTTDVICISAASRSARPLPARLYRPCRSSQSLHSSDRSTSFHPVEGFLEQVEVGRIAQLLSSSIDPFFFQRVLGWPIGFVKDAEDAGERDLGQFVSGEFVGDVVTQLVFRSVVPFLFLDQFEAAAFA